MSNVNIIYDSSSGNLVIETKSGSETKRQIVQVDTCNQSADKKGLTLNITGLDITDRDMDQPQRPSRCCSVNLRVVKYLVVFPLLLIPAAFIELYVRRFADHQTLSESLVFMLFYHALFKLTEAFTTILSENFIEDFVANPHLRGVRPAHF